MLELIKTFYESIKNKGLVEPSNDEPPVTHTKVFHKIYPRFRSLTLPAVDREDSQLETLIESRRSIREFKDTPLSMQDIAKILGSCRIVDFDRKPERRTYPSGGARFPVEIYLISFNIVGLNLGAYHYDFIGKRLEILLEQDLKTKQRELISPYLENPAASVFFTSVISRAEVKYGARAYPYSLIEAGHMGQNMQLAAAEIGVGCCSVSGFVDDTVKKILDLTEEEIPIYSIHFGWGKK